MRVTEKGQVTIPKHIRERLGIGPGSEVEFIEDGTGDIKIVSSAHDADAIAVRRVASWIEKIAGTGDPDVTTDDVMLATRGRRLDRAR